MNEERNFFSRIRQAFKPGFTISANIPEDQPPHQTYDGMSQTQVSGEVKPEEKWDAHEAYLYLYMYWHI